MNLGYGQKPITCFNENSIVNLTMINYDGVYDGIFLQPLLQLKEASWGAILL